MNLKVAIFQLDLVWENKAANFKKIKIFIKDLAADVDLVVLPEMFTTGFSMNAAQISEKENGSTVLELKALAKSNNIAIVGSLPIEDQGQYYNRLVWVFPNGTYNVYDKRHTFPLVGEDKVYTSGKDHLLINYKGFKISPFICYDLRFPVWCRNTEHVDVQIYVANWPAKRSQHWQSLLQVRAMENQCYVIGVNRVGYNNNEVYHSGNSSIYDFKGYEVINIEDIETLETNTLNKETLNNYRKRYPFLKDQDKFTIL